MRRTARNRCVALIAVMVVWLLGVGAQATTGLIAFSTDRDGVSEIYVVRPDGTGLRNLTRSPAREGIAMWSPARRQLAFWSDRDGESGIYTMNADGSGVRKLFTMPPDTYYWAWAPDERNFAFTSRRDGNQDIYVMGFDGGPWRNISDHPATLEYGTAWSPDSRRS
jgi:Tol biopolymer transport system component